MTTEQMLFTLLVVFASSVIQATVGFGFSLLAVPALVAFLPVTMVTPLIVLCCVLNNIIVLLGNRESPVCRGKGSRRSLRAG